MEEEKKELVQEEKDEKYLKLKKSNNRKKAVIIILLFIIVLAGLIIFIFFTDKKEEPKKEENKQQEKQEEKKEEPKKEEKIEDVTYTLSSTDIEIPFNGTTVKLHVNDDGSLFVNGVETKEVYAEKVIKTDKYMIFYNMSQCRTYISRYIDENLNVKEIKGQLDDLSSRQYSNYALTDGVLTAESEYCPCLDGGCPENHNVKFVYENGTLSVVKAN